MKVKFRFKIDHDCQLPHCWVRHLVTTGEAIEAWYKGASKETSGYNDVMTRRAKVRNSKDIEVVWQWIVKDEIVRIITAYEKDKEARYEGNR